MVEAKQKKHTIDAQLAEYEKRLRLRLLKEKLAALEREEYAGGAMPKIHVSVGALAAKHVARHPNLTADAAPPGRE